MKRLYSALLLLAASVTMYGQASIFGRITDSDGEALIGATIVAEGTNYGTVTDFDGNFEMSMTAGDYTLNLSYVGYTSLQRAVTLAEGQRQELNFTMQSDAELLDEVVVVGYGSVQKDDLTGAVNVVDEETFNKGAIVSPDQLIAGKIPGVQVTANSGEPGGQSSIRIRGGTSATASNEPLYVIDGFPIDNAPSNPGGFQAGRNPLNFLDPNDIENVTVLKDASAAAIYGSRGANGVILITTKSGGYGAAPRLTYNGWVSWAESLDQLQILNADQFRAGVTKFGPESLKVLGDSDTDWQKELVQTGMGQNHSLSLTGGGDKSGYRVSVGYLNQEGIIKTSETEKVNMSLSFNQKMLNDDLQMRINLNGAYTNDRISPNGVLGAALNYDPSQPVYDENSAFDGFAGYDVGVINAANNPLSELIQTQDYNEAWRGLGNIEFDYALPFVDGLSWKLNLGFDYQDGSRTRYLPTTIRSQARAALPGEARREDYRRQSKLLETYGTYDFVWLPEQHDLKVSAGYSWQGFDNKFPSYIANGFPNDNFGVNQPSAAEQVVIRNSVIANRLISFWGRINYELDNKYLLTATFRRDGSTRFGPENRWGNFPSLAAAWRISEEGFFGNGGVMSTLKLRVGWGITGSQEISDYLYLARFTASDQLALYPFGDEYLTTLRPEAYDENLKWEETETINFGFDFGFWNDRLSGTLDFYRKNTRDMLFNTQVPALSNLSNFVTTNAGEIKNQGVELGLSAVAIAKPNFTWDIGFNVSYNQNEVVETISDGQGGSLDIQSAGIDGGGIGNNIQILRTGEEAFSFYAYEHMYGDNGKPLVDGVDHNDDGLANLLDIYVDQNGDGVINTNDRIIKESPAPDFMYGLTSNMQFHDFDLSFTLRAQTGNYVYNNAASTRVTTRPLEGNSAPPMNVLTRALDIGFQDQQFLSDYFIEDASFLKLDNITLGYNISNLWDENNLRIYVTAQNLFVLTEYSGLDPEVGNSAALGAPELGLDKNTYPRSRTFLVGVNLQL